MENFVLVANEGTKGHVVIDAVQYLAIDDDAQPTSAEVKSAENRADWRYFGFHSAGKEELRRSAKNWNSCEALPPSDHTS